MSSGLQRRRVGGGASSGFGQTPDESGPSSSEFAEAGSAINITRNGYDTEDGRKIAFDPDDIQNIAEDSKQPKLTLMEEVLLLGLKDKQVIKTPIALKSDF